MIFSRQARFAFRTSLLALVSLGAAPDLSADVGSVAGDYHFLEGFTTQSTIRLAGNGTYTFSATYGGLEEHDDGLWRQEANKVVLTSSGDDRQPTFTLVSASRTEAPGIRVQLEGPDHGKAVRVLRALVKSVSAASESFLFGPESGLLEGISDPPYERLTFDFYGVFRRYKTITHVPSDPRTNSFVFLVEMQSYGRMPLTGVEIEVDRSDLVVHFIGRSTRDVRYTRANAIGPWQSPP